MSFQTNISIPKSLFNITYNSQILSLGSCFSVNIGNRLNALKYNIIQNPCGITFNPLSILSCIKRCIYQNTLLHDDMIKSGNLFAHSEFHGSFNNIDPLEYLKKANLSIKNSHHFIKDVDHVLITLGTAFVYKLKSNGQAVNNCHKLSSELFDRELLSTDEIEQALSESISMIRAFVKKDVKFILALSPVRHLKDGMIQNQKNKATCLLAIHNICTQLEQVEYFPSYEILLDELRDYRFYNEDMVHPTPKAINHVFNYFEAWCLDPDESDRRKEILKIQNSLNHRPLHPEDPAYADFKSKLMADMTAMENKFTSLSFAREKESLLR